MKKSAGILFKSVAFFLILTFSSTQFLFAANSRQMIQDAKASFEYSDDTRRGGGLDANFLKQSQAHRESLIDQQNALRDLQNLNLNTATQLENSIELVDSTQESTADADEPVLVETIQAKNYTSITGSPSSLYTTSTGGIITYSNRQITYNLSTAESGQYSLKLFTAQVTSKSAPPGYQFSFKITIDGQLKGTLDSPAQKSVYQASTPIDLGVLNAGIHTLIVEWVNDTQVSSTVDSNLGLDKIELYKEVSTTPPPTGEPTLDRTIAPLTYSSVSGSVVSYSDGTLGFYSNRSVTYTVNVSEELDYSLKLQTLQITSKNAPPGYKFHLNIYVDNVLTSSVDLLASKTASFSDFIDLGKLSTGNRLVRIQWTNDTNVSPYDTNLGIRNIELYKILSEIVNLPCDGISCEYDSEGKPIRSNYSDGTYALHEYYPVILQKSVSTLFASDDSLIKATEFYESGNEKSVRNADGSGYNRFDENFLGPQTGRISKAINADGSYTDFIDYFVGTNFSQFQKDYNASDVLIVTREYDSIGNLISTTYPEPPSDPVLVTTLNAQNYAYASGAVYNYPNEALGLWSNRSVNYLINIADLGEHALKLSTAQITSKNAPPGYFFNFNIKIDGVIVANVDLSSTKTFTQSDFIDLGIIEQGSHTLTLQWTNDYNISPYDSNAGFKQIEIYRIATVPPTPYFSLEESVEITDPTPDGGGFFGGMSYSINGLLILSDQNEGVNRVFHVFDTRPDSPTFGELLQTISSPLEAGTFGNTAIQSGNLLLISNLAVNGIVIFHAYDIDPQSPNFLDLLVTIEDPTPDDFFGNDFRCFAPFKKLYIINKDSLGKEVYNIFDLNPTNSTFGQLLGSIELPLQNEGYFSIITVYDITAVYTPGVLYLRGTDSLGVVRLYLYDVNPASATFEDLIVTISDPDPVSPTQFGSTHTLYNNYLILSDENSSGDIFFHIFDMERTSPTFGSSVMQIINPDLVTGDNFGSHFRVFNNLLLIGDSDGVGNGLLHVFDFNPLSLTFGDFVATFDFPLYPEMEGYLTIGGHEDYLSVSTIYFNNPNFGTPEVKIYDLDPQSATFGDLLATLEDPTPLTSGMSSFPFYFEDTALLTENSGGLLSFYGFDMDPDDTSFGQLISTVSLSFNSGTYGYSIVSGGVVVKLYDADGSTIHLHFIAINPS